MLIKVINILVATPLYPHWLEFRQHNKLCKKIIDSVFGRVIEVGAGTGNFKKVVLHSSNKVTEYIATDYSSWDVAFAEDLRISESHNLLDMLYQRKKREKLDNVCSALSLCYPDESFECHVSIQVLEHIPDPYTFFSEASRVLKKNGLMLLTAPFLFRMHPDEFADFFRVLPGGYRALAEKSGFAIEKIYSNTGIGTSASYLLNQWLIRIYLEGNIITRFLVFPLLPTVFFLGNIFGLLVDTYFPDPRFASQFLVILRKK